VAAAVAQNPFVSLDRYLEDHARRKYGWLGGLFLQRMKNHYARRTGIAVDSVNLAAAVRRLADPVLFVSFLSEDHLDFKSTALLYEQCASARKEWIVFRRDHVLADAAERKKYYDKIAAFIHTHLPRPEKQKTKYRKLVDREGGTVGKNS
jgi:hypothetical protein